MVIPALQTWTGGSGTFVLPAEPTVTTRDAALTATAIRLANDLTQHTGHPTRATAPGVSHLDVTPSTADPSTPATPPYGNASNHTPEEGNPNHATNAGGEGRHAVGTASESADAPAEAHDTPRTATPVAGEWGASADQGGGGGRMPHAAGGERGGHVERGAEVGGGGAEGVWGDVVLVLDPLLGDERGGRRFAREGYRLEVTPRRVVITAPTVTGVFYGTRSLLQMLARGAVPGGTAVDWPNYESRGFMLDVGRRFFTAGAVRGYIEVMGWFKLNEFQLHLNDNEIKAPDGDWAKARSAFRLKSDNPEFAGLAAEDGAYDRGEWESFEELASANGVTIIPEIDAPGHARAFVAFRPELGLDGGNSDHLDLSKPESTAFVRDVFAEFMPWFRAEEVHYGTDEYTADPELYRGFFNDMAAHVRALGKRPRAWGSATRMTGTADGYDRDVTINSWNNGWYGPAEAVRDGYRFINTNDDLLYIVPYADYYHGEGLDGRWLYENWEPHVFADGQVVEPGEPLLLGAMSAVWNDLVRAEYTELDVWRMVEPTFGLLAQKMWAGGGGMTYERFMECVCEVGSPGRPHN